MKNKYLIGGAIIVTFLGLMIYLFTQTNIQYEANFATIQAKSKTFKATGSWVREKNYEINPIEKTFSFYMRDAEGREMKVVYAGTMPNNFEAAQSVVVTGKYKDGYFHATDVLTKCPSKYEGKPKISSGM
ncbi:MAG: cytochrome c maturation protein CcmE [Bacteroidota bacterium]|nr:cytochrome c maturation protein CcmE [Bacteroidota bacterium]MDP4191100.1 cytochrome c maturation protein CcmE [Bacteroidota bacterium]MDP4195253.1 cytochrome c maturation protein CcmE [Bacteroidota bacterium]